MSNRDEIQEIIDDYIFIDSSSLDFLAQEPSLKTDTEGLRKVYNFRLRIGSFLGILLPCPICHQSQVKSRARVYSATTELGIRSLLHPSTENLLRDLDISNTSDQLADDFSWIVHRKSEILLLGELTGFCDNFYFRRLRFHSWKINGFATTQLLITCLSICISGIAISTLPKQYLSIYLNLFLNQPGFWGFLNALLFSVAFTFVYILLLPLTISKIWLRFTYKRIAESVCVLECLRILTELLQDEILVSSVKKRNLLIRMEVLALNNLLIPASYPHKASRESWVAEHFRAISAYIHDRQSWLLAPKQDTLENLRRDFHRLAQIYITGLYGEFNPEEVIHSLEDKKGILSKIPTTFKFIGYFFPPLIIIFILTNPSMNPGFNEDLLTLFFISWLLIGIDRYLNLGIIESILNLAKGLKDLN